MTVVDDFEEQVGGMGVVGQIATFINDQQGGASVVAEPAAAQAGGIAVEIGEQAGGAGMGWAARSNETTTWLLITSNSGMTLCPCRLATHQHRGWLYSCGKE